MIMIMMMGMTIMMMMNEAEALLAAPGCEMRWWAAGESAHTRDNSRLNTPLLQAINISAPGN